MADAPGAGTLAELLSRLEGGEDIAEGVLVRWLRSPGCPRELVERLALIRWVRALRVVPTLLLRHRACPRAFAWEMLPRLGWHDLLTVVRDPHTAPAVRRHGERKLIERLRSLTVGERTALARVATREILAAMLADDSLACVRAMLDNPKFTEADAIRLLNATRIGECAAAVVRHPRWGTSQTIVNTAVRTGKLPLGVAIGLLVTLAPRMLEESAVSPDLPAPLREAARDLVEVRRLRSTGNDLARC